MPYDDIAFMRRKLSPPTPDHANIDKAVSGLLGPGQPCTRGDDHVPVNIPKVWADICTKTHFFTAPVYVTQVGDFLISFRTEDGALLSISRAT